MGKAALPASKLDLDRHRARHEATAEITKSRHRPIQFREKRELAGWSRCLVGAQATQPVRLPFHRDALANKMGQRLPEPQEEERARGLWLLLRYLRGGGGASKEAVASMVDRVGSKRKGRTK